MTLRTQMVLRTLLEHPTHELYGLQLSQVAGLATGTIHPILARLEGFGWLESRREEINPGEEARPRRRYYRLSPEGAELARQGLANARTPISELGAGRPVITEGGV